MGTVRQGLVRNDLRFHVPTAESLMRELLHDGQLESLKKGGVMAGVFLVSILSTNSDVEDLWSVDACLIALDKRGCRAPMWPEPFSRSNWSIPQTRS